MVSTGGDTGSDTTIVNPLRVLRITPCFMAVIMILVSDVGDANLEKLGVRISIQLHGRRVDIQEAQGLHVIYPHEKSIIMKIQVEFFAGSIFQRPVSRCGS